MFSRRSGVDERKISAPLLAQIEMRYMRARRLIFILLAFYVVLLGGSAYYYQFFPFRVLHHAVMTIILAIWLAGRFRRGLPRTPVNIFLYLVIAVWFVAAIVSIDPRSALENVWFPLSHVVLFFILADLIQRGRQKWIFETLFLLAAVVVILAGAQFVSWLIGLGITPDTRIGWWGLGVLIPPESPMLYLPIGVSTWLAAWVAPLIIVAMVWGATAFHRAYRLPLRLLALGLFLVLLATTSRGGLIALAASVGGYLALRVVDRVRSQITSGMPWIIGGGAALAAMALAGILIIGRGEGRWTGDVLRLGLWRSAVQIIVNRPVLGIGTGLFGRANRVYRDPGYVDDRLGTAHNAYLNGAAETGLVGLLAGGLLMVAFASAWWRQRQQAEGDRRLRLDACMAALLGIAAQSFFDSFTLTTMVVPQLAIAAFCIVTPGSVLGEHENRPGRLPAGALMLLVVSYGIAFIPLDIAQNRHLQSLRLSLPDSLTAARSAAALDPGMNLYALQVDYLTAAQALSDEDLNATIDAYKHAVSLEPTWDTGWINLAGLEEQAGQVEAALEYLDRARAINAANVAALNWARIAEANHASDDESIIAAYFSSFVGDPVPSSEFWTQTPLRREALRSYILGGARVDERYRAAELLMPDLTEQLVPIDPTTTYDWWAVGEHALSTGKVNDAVAAFNRAVEIDRSNGDAYVGRARALISRNNAEAAGADIESARRDLEIAMNLPAFFEYPGSVRLSILQPGEDVQQARAQALPPRIQNQNFEGVLYQGRVAAFDLLPWMRFPGPGRAVMSPWYDMAQTYLNNGEVEKAINVYRAILDYAPAQTEAQNRLFELTEGS